MLVRAEVPEDVAAIFAVHCASFPTDAEGRLVDALRVAGRLSISLIAELNNEIIGHVAFSPVSTATGAIGAGLGPLAVLESHRRRGVGAQLVESGLAQCRRAGFGWAVVLGEPRYYARFGFRPASDFGLSDEFNGGPAFQAMELLAGELPFGSGLVRYSAEFAAFAQDTSAVAPAGLHVVNWCDDSRGLRPWLLALAPLGPLSKLAKVAAATRRSSIARA